MRDYEVLDHVDHRIDALGKIVDQGFVTLARLIFRIGARILAEQEDLQAALTDLESEAGVDNAAILNAFDALEAKIAEGATGPDLQPEVDRVKAVTAGLAAFTASLVTPPTP